MKIGLFGGTFNPPHIGHEKIAYEFYKLSGVDLLIIMPSFIPPHKAVTNVSAQDRFEMSKLAFLSLGEKGVNYTVDDYEIQKGGTSYTIDTVKHLMEKYGVEKVSLCMGSDMLLYLEKWKDYEGLMERCVIFSEERKDGETEEISSYADYLKEKYGADIRIMKNEALEASSTEIREDKAALSSLVNEKVKKYIEEKNLYR